MDKKIASTIKYFAIFDYFPNFMDVYTFFPEKINKKRLKKIFESNKYTPPQYSIPTSPRLRGASKYQISKRKLNNWRYKAYIQLLSLFPQIRLVGLSGSISMMNAEENDDIDLFIITAKNRLFTGRLISLVLAQLLGLRRSRDSETQFLSQRGPLHPESEKIVFSSSHHKKNNHETMKQLNNVFRNKVCLNLFFDESNLRVPKIKQTLFVGHEVLQMRPIIVKGDVYERFLKANEWVFRLFPNGKSKYKILNIKSQINYKRFKFKILNLFGTWNLGFRISNKIESFLKKLQLRLINKHKTTEIITSTQLWFHPNDFEKKIART